MIKLKRIMKERDMDFKEVAELMNVKETDVFRMATTKFPTVEEIELVQKLFGIHPDEFMNSPYYVGAEHENFKIKDYVKRNYPNIQFLVECKCCGKEPSRNINTLKVGTKCPHCEVKFY